ncbi:acyl-CoA carboxylase subunit beta [Thermodesulfobacteriota bacterium]
MTISRKLDELLQRKNRIYSMGGPERVAKQHRLGKLTARERVDLLLDPGSFVELGILGTQPERYRDSKSRETLADGVITGFGNIEGRKVCLASYDFLVLGGSMAEVGNKKLSRVMKMSIEYGYPFIFLADGSGARVQEHMGSRAAEPVDVLIDVVALSGFVPTVTAMMGPCFAGHANMGGLSDFVIMVKGTSSMGIAGPPLVEMAIGEKLTNEELGGSQIHCVKTGMAHMEAEDDQDCLMKIRQYLSYFPSNCNQDPPAFTSSDDPDAKNEELLHILPENRMAFYNMKKILRLIMDHGEFFEIQGLYARNVITCLARLNGKVVGVLANQPMTKAGMLDCAASDKAAHFISVCDAFNIPLVFLMDVPGFMVGSDEEKRGQIRHSAKIIYELGRCTVPIITVIIRKAYGLGYYAMGGRGVKPDLIVAWPSAEISAMGPEGGVNILYRKEIAESDDPEGMRKKLVEEFYELISPKIAAEENFIDDIIDPRDTRSIIIRALELAKSKRPYGPKKKHAVVPI